MTGRHVRVPPHSNESEQALLGGLMLCPDKIEVVASTITEEDFYRRDHRAVYRAMNELSLRGQPCDAVTLGDWFQTNGLDAVVDPVYLIELANNTPSAANIQAYAAIVRDKSLRRMVIDSACEMMEMAYGSEEESQTIIDHGVSDLMGMQKIDAKCEFTIREAITLAYKKASDAMKNGGQIPGIPSGIWALDDVLGGFHNQDLVVIGARPAMGKTAFLLNLAANCGLPCGIISGEMSAQQVGSRFLSLDSSVASSKLRNGAFEEEDWPRLSRAIDNLVGKPCWIYDKSGPTISEVQRITRKWHKQHGIKILFVDYIQRIRGVDGDKKTAKHERVSEVTQKLKDLARDLDIPVVALAQVSRDVDRREDKIPNMGDLSDSSEIEKEASVVATLYRPWVHDPDHDPKDMIVSIEKNREGACGIVRCEWTPETMRVADRGH